MKLNLVSIFIMSALLTTSLLFGQQEAKPDSLKLAIKKKHIRTIMWNKVGQREKIVKSEKYRMAYVGAEEENTFILYVPDSDEDSFILELSTFSTQAKPKPIAITRGIEIPADGTSPKASQTAFDGQLKVITFKNYNQREIVYNGEKVNVEYDPSLNLDKCYLSYQSDEDGYWLELSKLNDQKVVIFDKLCQTFVVATPELTTVRVTDKIRYEQIIWTAREDKSWEVRIGSSERGCKSDALNRLKDLRTKEYLENLPVETKNSRR